MIATQTNARPSCPECGGGTLKSLGDDLASCDRCRVVAVRDTLTRRWRPLAHTHRGRLSRLVAAGRHER